jgi:hypothetical protein
MMEVEARACVAAIIQGFDNLRALVLELYEREGWRALGYASWRACVVAEFERCQSYLYRLLEAAQIEKEISPMGEPGSIAERKLRALKKLEPGQRREVWDAACAASPGRMPTSREVENLVAQRRRPTADGPAPADDAPAGASDGPRDQWWSSLTTASTVTVQIQRDPLSDRETTITYRSANDELPPAGPQTIPGSTSPLSGPPAKPAAESGETSYRKNHELLELAIRLLGVIRKAEPMSDHEFYWVCRVIRSLKTEQMTNACELLDGGETPAEIIQLLCINNADLPVRRDCDRDPVVVPDDPN